jgi:LPXTG-motif cell wall-anchored protein
MALVVSENYFPGWRASVSGQDVPVFRANYNLIGVVLPAGAREVQLRFTDPAYQTGKTVTLIALGLAVAVLIAGLLFDRRRMATTPQLPLSDG